MKKHLHHELLMQNNTVFIFKNVLNAITKIK